MNLRPEEISSVIKEQIQRYSSEIAVSDTIAFASCISKGTPIGYPCPFAKRMRDLVQKEVDDSVRILDYTHDAGPEPETSQK